MIESRVSPRTRSPRSSRPSSRRRGAAANAGQPDRSIARADGEGAVHDEADPAVEPRDEHTLDLFGGLPAGAAAARAAAPATAAGANVEPQAARDTRQGSFAGFDWPDEPAGEARHGGHADAQAVVPAAAGPAVSIAPAAEPVVATGGEQDAAEPDRAADADADAAAAADAARGLTDVPAATGGTAAISSEVSVTVADEAPRHTDDAAAGAPVDAAALGESLPSGDAMPGSASAVGAPQAMPSIDVIEVAAAVQETVAGLATAKRDAAAPALARSARTGGGRRNAGRNAEPAGAPAKRRKAAAPADEVRSPAVAPVEPISPTMSAPAEAIALDATGDDNPASAPTPLAIDPDAQLRPLADRIRALQIETVDLRRAANSEMRRVNRLLLALAVVVLAGIAALVVQALALSNARGDAAALRQHVDRLVSQQETQQADLAAVQQRNDELGAQVQRLTNRVAIAAPRQPAPATIRRERRRR
ncbi:hypothetical protein GIY62_27980 [Burkholderia plantarii]|uniref:hypothetical protein n=1 Tax=Burkholderia plantarii TaxID=41899 RepID=UPI00272AC995|nr:hypothetical protein [Burkholderia plantarii]WLE61313.1 hypothetical protein GIY62_27980 [Burkholderia plantarii]